MPRRLLGLLSVSGFGYVASIYLRGQSGHSVWWDDWFYDGVLWAAGCLALWGARRGVGRGPGTFFLAVALLVYATGNTVWSLWVAPQASPPYPSVADYLWLSFYPLGFAAIWLLDVSRRGPDRGTEGGRDRGRGLLAGVDALVGALAVAAVGMLVSIDPIAHNVTGSPTAVLVNLAYPVGDLGLLVMLLSTAVASGRRPSMSWWLLGGSMLLWAVADSTYVFQVAAGTYQQGTILDAGWLIPIICLAWVPWITDRGAGHQFDPEEAIPTQSGLYLPAVLAAGCLGLLVWRAWDEAPWFAVLAGGALAAAGARLVLSVRELERLGHARAEARTDELTGLGNRRAFLEVLGARYADGESFHLLLMDLDGFKDVNDTLGHGAGDICLQAISKRMGAISSQRRALFRLGGDEFAVLTGPSRDGLDALVAQLLSEVARPVPIGDDTVTLAASIGIISCPGQATTPAKAVRRADAAMYHAKSHHLGHAQYEPTMTHGSLERGESEQLAVPVLQHPSRPTSRPTRVQAK